MNYNKMNNYDPRRGNRISIQDIIEYIEKNEKFINQPKILKIDRDEFETEPRLEPLNYRDTTVLKHLPKNLDSIFSSFDFRRYGVISNVNIPRGVDISYVSSILTLLVQSFSDMNEDDQIDLTQAFIRKFHREAKENFDLFEYSELGWKLKEFRNNVKNFTMGKDLMRYVADFLHVNIFILDNESDSLIYVGNEIFTKYKKNLFLLRICDDHFEPVYNNEITFLNHSSSVVKKLINSRFLVEYMDCNLNHNDEQIDFIVGKENLKQYLDNDEDESTVNDLLSDDMNGFEEDDEGVQCNDQLNDSDTKFGVEYNIAEGVTDKAQFTDDSDYNSDYDSDSLDEEYNVQVDKNKEDSEGYSFTEGEPSEEEGDDDESEQHRVDASYKVPELKKIAAGLGIKQTYQTYNGTTRSKTKTMLIKEINEELD